MEIHGADRRLRIVTVVALFALAMLGAVVMPILADWFAKLERLPAELALSHLQGLFVWFAGAGGIPLFAFAAYLWHFGSRVRALRRFPLPGSRVIRDTVILCEEAAVRRGRIIQVFGFTLALCGAAFLFFCWRLYRTLGLPVV